jgi:hypothetical protein
LYQAVFMRDAAIHCCFDGATEQPEPAESGRTPTLTAPPPVNERDKPCEHDTSGASATGVATTP